MKIINHNGHIKLRYNSKVVKKQKKYKQKKGYGINIFYQAYMPNELIDYLQIKDNILYFYENEDKKICITGRPPLEDFVQIKIQKANQFSLSRKIWKEILGKSIILTLDFGVWDSYLEQEGLLTIDFE